VIDEDVYDVSRYRNHPGSIKILIINGGKDATKAFYDRGHSDNAKKAMKKFKIGILADPENKLTQEKVEPISWSLRFDRFWMSACMFTTYYVLFQICTNTGY